MGAALNTRSKLCFSSESWSLESDPEILIGFATSFLICEPQSRLALLWTYMYAVE
jgi:hypothetical protein